MATLTIRNVPDDLHEALKERALQNRRSLNQEVISVLIETGEREVPDEAERKRMRSLEMIERVNQLRSGLNKALTAKEIDDAIEEGRR